MKDNVRKMKREATYWEKILKVTYLIKDFYVASESLALTCSVASSLIFQNTRLWR